MSKQFLKKCILKKCMTNRKDSIKEQTLSNSSQSSNRSTKHSNTNTFQKVESKLVDSFVKQEADDSWEKSIRSSSLTRKQNFLKKRSIEDPDIFPDESRRLQKIGPYIIESLIGRGSFGKVYKCSRDGIKYALKLELSTISLNSQLKNEYMIYKKLKGIKGIPKIYALGEHEECYYMVMELLGMNLHRIHELKLLNFTTALVLKIGLRLLQLFEEIHEKGIIVRDLKPDNILINDDGIFLIDLGMSKYYMRGKKHIHKRMGKELAGTVRYASINTHLGIDQSRRDDLETLLYSLVYLCKGRLPWMGIVSKNRKEKFIKIWKKKEDTPIKSLIKDIPNGEVLGDALKYVRELGFEERPDYYKIMMSFRRTLKDIGEHSVEFSFGKEKKKLQDEIERYKTGGDKKEKTGGLWKKFKGMFCGCFL